MKRQAPTQPSSHHATPHTATNSRILRSYPFYNLLSHPRLDLTHYHNGDPKTTDFKVDDRFFYLFIFSIPGSRLEMSFVKKVKLSSCRITFFQAAVRPAVHFAALDCSVLVLQLFLCSQKERE